MNHLGNSLFAADHYEDALSVKEAELSMHRRLGSTEEVILCVQGNLASTYHALGRLDSALQLKRDVYSGRLKLLGPDHINTVTSAYNYANSLMYLKHFKEAKSLMRKTIPVAPRLFGENSDLTLNMRKIYAITLYKDGSATLDDLREAVTTLEETERIARRVFGGAHPLTVEIERPLRAARAILRARADA